MDNDLIIECSQNLNEDEKAQVLNINTQNLVANGGQLHYKGILEHKYAILAKINNKVIGYALLMPKVFSNNDLYIMQVAIDKKYQHNAIGSILYEYAYEHSKGYEYLTANANEKNMVSRKFHNKMGFESIGNDSDGIIYAKPISKDITKTFDDAKPVRLKLKEELNEERVLL